MNGKILGLFLMAGIALNLSVLYAEDMPEGMPGMDEKMAAAMELMRPGEAHRKMDPMVGTFKATATFWMGANAPAQTSEATSENKWLLDGRFLKQKYTGDFMGKPFEGINVMGYDTVAKEYQTIWIDNFATGMMTGAAQYDEASQSFTEEGVFSCPMNGKKDNAHRAVTTIIDNDHYMYEAWHDDPETGENFKAMKIVYERTV